MLHHVSTFRVKAEKSDFVAVKAKLQQAIDGSGAVKTQRSLAFASSQAKE